MKLNKFFKVVEHVSEYSSKYTWKEYQMKMGIFGTTGNDWKSQTNRAAGYAEHEKLLGKYMDDECVVAYHQTEMGLVFVIKGKIKFFPFYWNQFSTASSYSKSLMRMEDRDAVAYLQKYGKIVNDELWMKFSTITAAKAI